MWYNWSILFLDIYYFDKNSTIGNLISVTFNKGTLI